MEWLVNWGQSMVLGESPSSKFDFNGGWFVQGDVMLITVTRADQLPGQTFVLSVT